MILNLLQDLTLVLFMISAAWLLWQKRREAYGIAVRENGEVRADGRQGMAVTIGRSRYNDVRLEEETVSRAQATVRFEPRDTGGKFLMTEWGKTEGVCQSHDYMIAGHVLDFSLPAPVRIRIGGALPLCMALLMVTLQSVATVLREGSPVAALPHLVLVFYLWMATLLRTDRAPLSECIFSIFLTYYIDATLYPVCQGEALSVCVRDAVLGTVIYTGCALAATMLLKMDFNRKVGARPMQKWLRLPVVAVIAVLIVLNVKLANNVNGAYNWITIGGVSFQPSELIKVLLVFALILPDGKPSVWNWFYLLVVPGGCICYGLVIKDTGVLLQFAILTAAAILLQYRSFGSPLLLVVAGGVGARAVLMLSSTAAARFSGWLGQGNTLLQSLTGAGVIESSTGYGYQSVHALVAVFENGGLLGNGAFDVLRRIPAANSDLVMSMVGQRHGWPVLFLILGLYGLLVAVAMQNTRHQTRFQQMYSYLGVTLIVMAMGMNLAGTFGIFPLTGVVSPAVSDGISAAVSYGALFGAIGSSSLTKPYRAAIESGEFHW